MSMRTSNWDAMIASAPLDKQAAMIRDGRGGAEDIKIDNCYKEQPALRAYTGGSEDITGQRFGRLTVVGLSDINGSWVCRCDCGHYARQKLKALRSQAEKGRAECGLCDYVHRAERGEIPDAAERVILRSARKAQASAASVLDANIHARMDALMAALDPDIDQAEATSSISRWMQLRFAKQRAAASYFQHSEKKADV